MFDGPSVLGFASGLFSEMQSGVLGGHLRVAVVGAFDQQSQRGLEMMALGPLAADNDTIVVAIRPHTPSANESARWSFDYFSVSLDRRHPGNSTPIPPSTFYLAVLEHAIEWNTAFETGMQVCESGVCCIHVCIFVFMFVFLYSCSYFCICTISAGEAAVH